MSDSGKKFSDDYYTKTMRLSDQVQIKTTVMGQKMKREKQINGENTCTYIASMER